MHQAAANYDGIENIDACFANLGRGSCADIHVDIFEVAGFRRIGAAGLQMHGEARDDAVYPLAAGRFDAHRLCGIHFVEDWRQAALWQALYAQVAVRCDFADDEAGLINRGHDQAMRRATADGDDNVAEIVRRGLQAFQARANLIRQLIFVA